MNFHSRYQIQGKLSSYSIYSMKLHFEQMVGQTTSIGTKVVLSWAMGSVCLWKFLDKVERIWHSIDANAFSVSRVPSEAIFFADELAKQGLSSF